MIWFFRLVLFSIIYNGFLATNYFVEGIFTTKEIALYITAGFSCIVLGIYFLRRNLAGLQLNWLDILAIGLLVIMPIMQLGFSNEVLFPNVLQQIAFGCIYLTIRLIAASMPKPILANVLAETITLVLFFHLLLAFAQVFGVFPVHYPGAIATGMFFNPGPFAIYTTALLLFVLVLSLVNIKTKKYRMAAVQVVLSIAAIWLVFTSQSRSAWIGLFIGFALVTLWIVIQNGQFNKIIKFKWFYSTCFLLTLLIGIGIWKVYEMKKDSAEGRQLTWSAAILMAKEHPLLGVGTGNYAANNIQYQGVYFENADMDNPLRKLAGDSRYAFNDILQTAAEKGIIGLFLFLGILWMVARQFFVRLAAPSSAQLILMGGGLSLVIVIIFAGLTAYPMQMIPLALVFWMGIALLASQMKVSSFMIINSRTPKMIVGIILLLMAPVFFGYAYVRGNAYAEWKKMEGISLDQKAYIFKKLYPTLKDNGEFLRQYGTFLIEQNDPNQALLYLKEAILRNPAPIHYYALADCYADLKKFPEAIATVHVVKKGIPNLMRPRHLEANYTLYSGDSVRFLSLAQDALDFEPKINNPEVMEMKQELRTQMQKVLAKNAGI